jgi:hypothetical protein
MVRRKKWGSMKTTNFQHSTAFAAECAIGVCGETGRIPDDP